MTEHTGYRFHIYAVLERQRCECMIENGRIARKSGHGTPGLSSTTVRSLHLMLHSALERAVKERLILRNPTEDCIQQNEHRRTDKRGPAVRFRHLEKPRSGLCVSLCKRRRLLQIITVGNSHAQNPCRTACL